MRQFAYVCAIGATGLIAPSVAIAANDMLASTIYIESGYMKDGAFVKVDQGSGFVVNAAGWIATAKHLTEAPLPVGQSMRAYRGALAADWSSSVRYELFETTGPVVSADMALLRFSPNINKKWTNLKVLLNHAITLKDDITGSGFPLTKDYTERPGRVTELNGFKGAIGVNAGFYPGMSGGPVVLGASNCVIGLVLGGSGVPALDYFTPIHLAKSLLEIAPAEFIIEHSGGETATTKPLYERGYQIDETNDDHQIQQSSKNYSIDFKADPNTTISSARLIEESVNNAHDQSLNISADRMSVTFRYRLESGPIFDRWRGWWHGQVVLTLQLKPDSSAPGANSACSD